MRQQVWSLAMNVCCLVSRMGLCGFQARRRCRRSSSIESVAARSDPVAYTSRWAVVAEANLLSDCLQQTSTRQLLDKMTEIPTYNGNAKPSRKRKRTEEKEPRSKSKKRHLILENLQQLVDKVNELVSFNFIVSALRVS